MWVRYFESANTTVYCMSSLWIHMSNFSYYIILSLHLRCSEPRVVILISTFIIVTYFYWGHHIVFDIVIVTCECAVLKLRILRSIVCQNYKYICLTFLIVLFCCSICAVMYHGLFRATCILPMHWALCHHFSIKKHNTSKGKCDIL